MGNMTRKEIAASLNVSPAAVSLVLNNKKGVGEAKRKEIQKALLENDYQIVSEKKLLFVTYRFHGKLVEENKGFVSVIFESIQAHCKQIGYELSLVVCDSNLEQVLSSLDQAQYQGMIFLGTELQREHFHLFNAITLPYVVLDNNMRGVPCNTIGIDNEQNVNLALSLCKVSPFLYLKSSLWTGNFDERSEAVARYAAIHNLEFQTIEVDPTLLGSYRSIKKRGLQTYPNFVFADNDIIALGAMKAFVELGIKLPEDMALVGFDDIAFAAVSVPSLTTVSVPKQLIGEIVVSQILKVIASRTFRRVKTQVAGELIIRESAKLPQ